MARAFSRSKKECLELSEYLRRRVCSADHVYIFDRIGDSFEYLSPASDEDEPVETKRRVDVDYRQSMWLRDLRLLRYQRKPRVFVNLTSGSLQHRVALYGDAGIEQLIGNVETGEHSLTIVDDSPRFFHRICRRVFAGAAAAVILARSMLVLPTHGKSIRIYEAAKGDAEARLIKDSIGDFYHMRRFRHHSPTVTGIVTMLKRQLSYDLSLGIGDVQRARAARAEGQCMSIINPSLDCRTETNSRTAERIERCIR